jgi:hypothetical protein
VHIVDQDIAEGEINVVPFKGSLFQAAQNNGTSLCQPDIVMVPVFPANRYDVRPDLGYGVSHGSEWIGDDFRSAAGSDLKKGVAEPSQDWDFCRLSHLALQRQRGKR